MQEADMSMTSMALSQQGGQAGDETLLVRFYINPKKDREKSLLAGRDIYTDTPYISIMQPGNKDSVIIRPASKLDKNRFPRHWDAFNTRQVEELIEGTPLSQWPAMSPAQVEELKFLNVRTVEQLVAMSDTNSQGFMGISQLKERARKFLEFSDSNAATNAVIAAEKRIVELESQVKELLNKPTVSVEPQSKDDLAAMVATLVAEGIAKQAPKPKRKRRSPAEMAAAKAEEAKTE
jgi:hypothetical protein